VRAQAAGEFANAFDCLVAPLLDNICGAELLSERDPVGVVAEQVSIRCCARARTSEKS